VLRCILLFGVVLPALRAIFLCILLCLSAGSGLGMGCCVVLCSQSCFCVSCLMLCCIELCYGVFLALSFAVLRYVHSK
jgi:hypothetical protein